jgi:hypothetical protein
MSIKFVIKMIKCRNPYYRLKLVMTPGFDRSLFNRNSLFLAYLGCIFIYMDVETNPCDL